MVVSVVPGAETEEANIHDIPTRTVAGRDLSRKLGAQVTLSRHITSQARDAVADFRPDVLHATSIHFRATASAARIARSTDLPLVTTAHVGSISALPLPTRTATFAYEHTIGRAVLRYFNLHCIACGSYQTYQRGFLFKQVGCRKCRREWKAGEVLDPSIFE